MGSTAEPNIVGVHGISQQQAGRQQLLTAWAPALADGVERAVGRDGPSLRLDLAYYADLFSDPTELKGPAVDDVPELDDDTVQFFDRIEDEVVDVDPPEEVTKGFKRLPGPVARLAAWLDHRFGIGSHLLFIGDLIQVRRYQRDDELAQSVRRILGDVIGPQTRVVVGHSLGSVVAYEYLCLERDHDVDTLITLGSPLGLRSIQNALRTAGTDGRPMSPPGLRRWVNVFDPADPVACGGGLSVMWPLVVDERVDNEANPHAAERYLGKKPTGAALAASLG